MRMNEGKKTRMDGWKAMKTIQLFLSQQCWNLIGFPLKGGGRERIKTMRFSFHCVIIFFLALIATDGLLFQGLGAGGDAS